VSVWRFTSCNVTTTGSKKKVSRENSGLARVRCFLFTYHVCLLSNVVCAQRARQSVDDFSYCTVMQCETDQSSSVNTACSDWMLAKIVKQCEKNSDPTTLKIMQSELGISLNTTCTSMLWKTELTNKPINKLISKPV